MLVIIIIKIVIIIITETVVITIRIMMIIIMTGMIFNTSINHNWMTIIKIIVIRHYCNSNDRNKIKIT